MELYNVIKKNFPKIEKLFTEETLLEFSQSLPDELEKYNIGLGTMIRLKLLRPKSTLYQSFIQNGFKGKDKMTVEIIKSYHKHLRRKI